MKRKKTQQNCQRDFILQALRVMLKLSLYCFDIATLDGLQPLSSNLWALAFPQAVMIQTHLWKAIKVLEWEPNKTQNSHQLQRNVWKLYLCEANSVEALLQQLSGITDETKALLLLPILSFLVVSQNSKWTWCIHSKQLFWQAGCFLKVCGPERGS